MKPLIVKQKMEGSISSGTVEIEKFTEKKPMSINWDQAKAEKNRIS